MAKGLEFFVRYDPAQDRMLLLAAFPEGTEVRSWMTRRLITNLLGQVDALAERMVPEEVTAPEAKKEVAQFQREAALQQAEFRKTFEGGRPHPELGEEALLVSEIRLTPANNNALVVRLTFDNGKYAEWRTPRDTFWGVLHLIERQARRADWNLTVTSATPPAAEQKPPPAEPAKDKPRLN